MASFRSITKITPFFNLTGKDVCHIPLSVYNVILLPSISRFVHLFQEKIMKKRETPSSFNESGVSF